MRKFPSRSLVAVGVVAALSLAAPLAASADRTHNPPASLTQKQYQQHERAYQDSRKAIQKAFQYAVDVARSTYVQSLTSARSSTQRSAARQALGAAIIQAAATRSAALISLGNPPIKLF